ncbi:GTP-binding protein [Perkinsela sp. CCAP 1560/4]|nr:GTP-binding protein [Perkinsela sp. CCAP 1560/4]|eukprot:KNH04780.1 GTP-binding protein [Perkinsela sp. CCAP 1560/4]
MIFISCQEVFPMISNDDSSVPTSIGTPNAGMVPNEPFRIADYIERIRKGYKSTRDIDQEAKKQLDSIVQEAQDSLLQAERMESEGKEDGWQIVKRNRKGSNINKAFSLKMRQRAPKENPLPSSRFSKEVFGMKKKDQKKDFYSFQLTDRWREKADRIASKLNAKKDIFGRPIQTARISHPRNNAIIRDWKSKKLSSAKQQREVRSFQSL